jgi:hypothetical protein
LRIESHGMPGRVFPHFPGSLEQGVVEVDERQRAITAH